MGQCAVRISFDAAAAPPQFPVLLCADQTGCSGKKKEHDDKTAARHSARPDAGLFHPNKKLDPLPFFSALV